MREIDSEHAFLMALATDLAKLNCLVFVEESERQESLAKAESLEKVLPSDARLLLIRENDETAALFSKYGVEDLPSFVILNADFSVWRTLKSVSLADVSLTIEELLPAFLTNLELEKTKFNQIVSRVFLPDRFLLLDFASDLSLEFAPTKKAMDEHQLPYKSLTLAQLKEDSPTKLLAHLIRITNANVSSAPVAYINNRLFTTHNDLEEFVSGNSQLIASMRQKETSRIEAFLKKSSVVVVFDSSTHAVAAQALGDKLRQEKVMFAILDCAGRSDIASELERRLDTKRQNWPCLVVEGRRVEVEEFLQAQLTLEKYSVKSPIERAKTLISSSPVFVFMKGSPEFPQCGFSRQLVDLLSGKGVEFGSYNVLVDPELRESVKTMSQWKTYPQLYVQGSLVGGLDIAREMEAAGELDELLKPFLKAHQTD